MSVCSVDVVVVLKKRDLNAMTWLAELRTVTVRKFDWSAWLTAEKTRAEMVTGVPAFANAGVAVT